MKFLRKLSWELINVLRNHCFGLAGEDVKNGSLADNDHSDREEEGGQELFIVRLVNKDLFANIICKET